MQYRPVGLAAIGGGALGAVDAQAGKAALREIETGQQHGEFGARSGDQRRLVLCHAVFGQQAADIPDQRTITTPVGGDGHPWLVAGIEAMRRSEEHTSELQSLMRSSYAVF